MASAFRRARGVGERTRKATVVMTETRSTKARRTTRSRGPFIGRCVVWAGGFIMEGGGGKKNRFHMRTNTEALRIILFFTMHFFWRPSLLPVRWEVCAGVGEAPRLAL